MPEKQEYGPFRTFHTFPVDNWLMRCEELLYVSDSATKSHHTVKSLRNKGKLFSKSEVVSADRRVLPDAQIAGRIVTDMSFLRDKGHIEITYPKPDKYGVVRGEPHYVIEYDLYVILDSRNLRYEARWPPLERGADQRVTRKRCTQQKAKVKQVAQVSIAAAFQPGTG